MCFTLSGGNGIMLRGKRVLITGGSRGNGEGIARGMIENQAEVVVFDKIKGNDTRIHYVEIDITYIEMLAQKYKEVTDKYGVFDVLVNNAGITFGATAEEYPMEKWDLTLNVNLTAPFNLSKLFANDIISSEKKGSIINITSLGAEFGFPDNPAYCASKGGLKQLTKALALDWAKYGIRVNNVGPGYMHTNMTNTSYNDPQMYQARLSHMMIKRWGEPADLAGICVFLASSASEYITGQDIYVDGGWTAKGL